MENLQSALKEVVINASNGDQEAQNIINDIGGNSVVVIKDDQSARREQFLKENYVRWNNEGMKLRERRLKLGMSLNDVANKLGTSASRIGRLEKGCPVSMAKHLIASCHLLYDYTEAQGAYLRLKEYFFNRRV